jgi:hypothetical protein
MGRLENIIARNRGWHRPSERSIASLVFGLIVVMILVLAAFTGLGEAPRPAAPAPPAPEQRGKRIDGVLLRTPSAPSAPTTPTTPPPSAPPPPPSAPR